MLIALALLDQPTSCIPDWDGCSGCSSLLPATRLPGIPGPNKVKITPQMPQKVHNPLKSTRWQEQRRGLHFSCPQEFHLCSPTNQDSLRDSWQSSQSITLSEQLLHVPCCPPTAFLSWHSPCGGRGAIRVRGHPQLIPTTSTLLSLLSHTELLSGLGDSKSATSCTTFFLQQGKNSSFTVLLGIKSTISLKGRMHSWTLLSEIHPTSPVHTQAHITHNSCYCTKKPHSATPRSASKGNVNVKGKVLLVCRISIIQLEISIKVLCSLVF